MRLLLLLWSVLAVSACSLIPPLDAPAPSIPVDFPDRDAAPPGASSAGLDRDAVFRDPRLRRILALALENNRDLRLALLNVEAARLQNRIQASNEWPGVDAQTSYSRERAPIVSGNNADGGGGATTEQLGVNLGFNAFEIDLFGRVHALSEAAFARYLASRDGYRAARLALVGAVADAYFAERLAVEQRALAESTLTDWRQSLDLARLLRRSGRGNDLEVARAEAQVASALADLRARDRAVARAGNALRLVVGAALPADPPAGLPLDGQPVVTRLPVGLPSDLLLNRPDIRQAEGKLAAANADVGAARAALFPRLSLTGALGVASPSLAALFDSPQSAWSLSPRLTLPILDGGRLDAERGLASVRKREAAADYEKAIQTAFREVADGLAGSATLGRQIAAQNQSVAGAARAVALANSRYRAGLESRLELLDAQRQLQAARQTLLALRHEEIVNAIALYKALGGGALGGGSTDGKRAGDAS